LNNKRAIPRKNSRLNVTGGYPCNVDSFGHSIGLPQLLAKAGYKYYVYMRPHAHELDLPLLFWWKGRDGARVLTWRISTNYSQGPDSTPEELEALIKSSDKDCFAPGFNDGLFFLGVGNHGGGPTKKQIEKILELQQKQDQSLPVLQFSTIGRFFQAIEAAEAFAQVPIVEKELLHHATGCYAAMGAMKQWNRRAEQSLAEAETLGVMANQLIRSGYPEQRLEEAWWSLLFNQFHDILAGTCIESTYQQARDSIGGVCDLSQKMSIQAAFSIARQVNTSAYKGNVLFVVNSLPWIRKTIVQLDTFTSPPEMGHITHLESPTGQRYQIQWLNAEASFGPYLCLWQKMTAVVDLPACGYEVFSMIHNDAGKSANETLTHKWGIDAKPGGIPGLYVNGVNLLQKPAALVVIDDQADTWGHNCFAYRAELGRPHLQSTVMLEDGPVCRMIRQRFAWHNSVIELFITQYKDIPGLMLRFRINWQEQKQRLMLEIPTNLKNVKLIARVAGAVVCREATGSEEPMQEWVAMEGAINANCYSVGIIQDAVYNYNCLQGLFRTTLVRSAYYVHHDPIKITADSSNPYLDQGWQEKRLWLVWGKDTHAALGIERLSAEFMAEPMCKLDSIHGGMLPPEASFLRVKPESIIVTAIKKSLDGEDHIIRLQEMRGCKVTAIIEMPLRSQKFETCFAPWEIKTIKIGDGPAGGIVEMDITETTALKRLSAYPLPATN